MKKLIILVPLVVIVVGLLLSGIADTKASIADSNIPDNEISNGAVQSADSSSSASASITITMYACEKAESSSNSGNSITTERSSSLDSEWVRKTDTPDSGGYGEAVVSIGNSVYIARCLYATSIPQFWRYDSTTDDWNSLGTTGLPPGAFRNGTALTGDGGDYIYALLGGRYSDSNRRLFYRYSIYGDSWKQLADTPHAQCAGDAITWSGYDNYVYALIGSNKHGANFARYSYDSWEVLPFNPSWTVTDDGASLVWTGGEYLYALRGEWNETIPNGDFAQYHIPTQTWQNMTSMPESDGVGDGASLLWGGSCSSEYSDYIFALGGGAANEEPGYNSYCYSISSNAWEELEPIPCPVGYYVGNRLGYDSEHIYYWQGAPSTWDCGGDAFYWDFTTGSPVPAVSWEFGYGPELFPSPSPANDRPYLDLSVDLPTASEPSQLLGVYWLDESERKWKFFIPGWGEDNTLRSLEAGQAYLVQVSGACTWEIPQ